MSHLEARLEHDINKIRAQMAEQSQEVIRAVKDAVHALQTGNKPLAYDTILRDHPINRQMREIDRICHRFIAVHLPSAGHLRLLSAVIRVNIELERIGDYAVTIAREGVQMSAPPSGVMARELERMSGATQQMLAQACRAFRELDANLARSTILLAAQMESSLDALYAEMMSNDQHHKIKDIFATFVVFTQLKRVSDQSKNLCEETIFAVTGKQKEPKIYGVLFVDRDNGLLSKLAEATGRNSFAESGSYRSAGDKPAAIDDRIIEMLQQRGLEISSDLTSITELTEHDIAEQTVIVSLDAPVERYFPTLPFHTSAQQWELPETASVQSEQELEALYREVAVRVKDLMELLRGEGAT